MNRKDFQIFVDDDSIAEDFLHEGFSLTKDKTEAHFFVRKYGELYDATFNESKSKYPPRSKNNIIEAVIVMYYIEAGLDIDNKFVGIRNIGPKTELFNETICELENAGYDCREIFSIVPHLCGIVVEIQGNKSDVFESRNQHGYMNINNTLERVQRLENKISNLYNRFTELKLT
jgi:hypothetical protein